MLERKAGSLKRWLSLLTILMGGNQKSVPELAERFGVTTRTIYRDILALEEVGVPIVCENNRYAIMDEYRLRPVQFSPDEVLALAGALDFAGRSPGLNPKSARSALEKLLVGMPSRHRDMVHGLDEALVVEPVPAHSVECAEGIEENLTAAIQGRHPIRMSYEALAADEPTERVVHPYGFVYRGVGLYLIGYCELRKSIRTFRANRIASVTVLPTVFKRPPDFDLESYLDGFWTIEDGPLMHVRLRFSPRVAKLARETVWHPTQRTKDQPDGSVVLTMETRGRNELARWLVGFGGTVEVLEPADLRETVVRTGREIVDLYADQA